jgi:vancomycin resistance protein YoaR
MIYNSKVIDWKGYIMNAILFTGDNSPLTKEEVKVFKEAKKIISTNNDNNKKKHSKLFIFGIILIVLLIILGVLSTIFALINMNNDKILNGISILGIDVSNKTKEDAKETLTQALSNRLDDDVILKHNEEMYTFLPNQVDANYDLDKVINQAYMIGRDGNIFQNNLSIINTYLNKFSLTPDFTISSDKLNELVTQMDNQFKDGLKDPSYEIDGNNLVITAGNDGAITNKDELKNIIIEKFIIIDYNTDPIIVPIENKKCASIDIDKIHTEIYQAAVDAYFSSNPYTIHASSNGLDFKISIDEAKALIDGNSSTYTIPLKVLYPNVTTDQIGSEAFPNQLASYSTNYSSSSSNRSTNIALATSKINGKVIMPGETFSFNSTVGQRTAQSGFKEAGVYVNGTVATGIGGGICQVSSTLYNAVLRANLEIVDRSNHEFLVGYVPIGTDATVSWGSPDFKFKNSRSYPIKISATTSGKNVYIKIWGLNESTEYDVEIQSYKTSTISYKTTYTTDSSLSSGQTKVIQNGSNGAKSETYRILKLNGEVISKTLISRDTYQPHNRIIAKGN